MAAVNWGIDRHYYDFYQHSYEENICEAMIKNDSELHLTLIIFLAGGKNSSLFRFTNYTIFSLGSCNVGYYNTQSVFPQGHYNGTL